MGEMVERVAKALRAKEWGSVMPWEEAPADDRQYWLDSARAAIRAMREPTQDMLRAGLKSPHCGLGYWWMEMVDAALAPPTSKQPRETQGRGE